MYDDAKVELKRLRQSGTLCSGPKVSIVDVQKKYSDKCAALKKVFDQEWNDMNIEKKRLKNKLVLELQKYPKKPVDGIGLKFVTGVAAFVGFGAE